jgi:glycerophosphoryl diester phosphodiesterase
MEKRMLIFGHRGARGEAPENTLSGFAHARHTIGVSAFELDVHLSADGELVVIHDATVDRTTNATGAVKDFTVAQLAAMDARSVHTDWPEPAGVPTLAQVLAAHADGMSFAIEIKTDSPDRLEKVGRLVAEHVKRFGLEGRATVTSFDAVALEIMRDVMPDLPRACIGAYDTPAFLETARRLACRQADMPVARSSPEMVAEAQASGMRVVGWQGNTPEDLETLLAWRVNGITSDYPARAIAYLRERSISTDTWS